MKSKISQNNTDYRLIYEQNMKVKQIIPFANTSDPGNIDIPGEIHKAYL